MGWNGVITDVGAAVIAQLSVPGNTLVITKVQTGSGVAVTMKTATTLTTPVATGVLTSVSEIEGGCVFRCAVGPYTSAYTMKELGIFGKIGENGTETLIALVNNDGSGVGIPLASEFPDFVLRLAVPMAISNTSSISFDVPSEAYVTNADFEEAISDLQNGKKDTQSPVADPTASGTSITFIKSISQDAQGVITAAKSTVSTMGGATSSAAGSTGLVPTPAAGANGKFLKGDGTWGDPEIPEYSDMSGATSESAGSHGLVPAPAAGDQAKFLRGDGSWAVVSTVDTKNTAGATNSASKIFLVGATTQGDNPQTYSNSSCYASGGYLYSGGVQVLTSHQSIAGKKNTQSPVSDPAASGTSITFIKTISQDAQGVITPSKATVSTMGAASSGAAGSVGLVPAPAKGDQGKYLRGDGTWQTPPDTNTTYSAGSGLSLSGTTFSLALPNSGVAAGTYGPSANVTGSNNSTINVPQITVDAQGRVTSVTNRVYTSVNTDTNTTNTAGSTNTTSKIYLCGATSQAAYAQTYSNSSCYAYNGYLYSGGVQVLTSHQSLASCLKTSGDQTASGVQTFSNTTESSSTSTGAVKISGGLGVAKNIYAAKVYNAVWNDYAECRKADTLEPGRCVMETKSGVMKKTADRLMPGCKIVSDTFGSCMGETESAKTPIAVAGRVLAYPARDRELYNLGDAVCSGPNGTVDIMTREEIREYPERIVGTVSEIPEYAIWVGGTKDDPKEIRVDGRIWIYVR